MVSNIFYVHPYLGKIPILTNTFSNGLKSPTRESLVTSSLYSHLGWWRKLPAARVLPAGQSSWWSDSTARISFHYFLVGQNRSCSLLHTLRWKNIANAWKMDHEWRYISDVKLCFFFLMWNHLFIFECLDTLWCFSKYVFFGNWIDIFWCFWSCLLRHPLFKHPTLEHDKMMGFNRYVKVTIRQIEFSRLTYMLYPLAFGCKCQFDLILYKFFLDARYNKKPLQSQLPSRCSILVSDWHLN